MKQTCFVVMGYGKKMDYATGKTVDLDKVYKTIIQPVVASAGYRCVRGDEVKDPSLIDRSMYALLMHAELVIADVTTFNPNAVYELGGSACCETLFNYHHDGFCFNDSV